MSSSHKIRFRTKIASVLLHLCKHLIEQIKEMGGEPQEPHYDIKSISKTERAIEYWIELGAELSVFDEEVADYTLNTLSELLEVEGLTLRKVLYTNVSGGDEKNGRILAMKDKIADLQKELEEKDQIIERLRKEQCEYCPWGSIENVPSGAEEANDFEEENVDNLSEFILRDRSNRVKNPASDIDLYEDGDGKKFNRRNKRNSNNTVIVDYIMIIEAMYELGFFTKFDATLNGNLKDLERQKPISKKAVFEAFGNAVNIQGMGVSYNNNLQFALQKKNGVDTGVIREMARILEDSNRNFMYHDRCKKDDKDLRQI